MEFTLRIFMGNEAMLTAHDLVQAIRKVAKQIEKTCEEAGRLDEMSGKVMDLNGNRVGAWEVFS